MRVVPRMSCGPLIGYGTTILTGLEGNGWALAPKAAKPSTRTTSPASAIDRSRIGELQRLDFQVFLETVAAELATVPRLLEATERRVRVERAPVYIHPTRAQAAGD